MITGVIIVIIFAVIAVLMMMRKIPAVLALPVMAVGIALAAGLPLTGDEGIFTNVLTDGSLKLAGTYVAVLFSCWLSQILFRTGVTDVIIKVAAELGGDKPYIISLALCAVTAFLFTVLYGTGAVAMVGTIVLPILMSIGIPPIVACNVFLAAMSTGYTLNPANISVITQITGVASKDINLCAMILFVVSALFTILYLSYSFKKNGIKFAFSAPAEPTNTEKIEKDNYIKGIRGVFACLTPVVVVAVMLIFGLEATTVFIIGIVWVMVFTFRGKWSKFSNIIVQSCYEGFKEGAPTVALMFGIGMILNAMTAPTTQAVIKPFMSVITPHTAVGLIIFVCILAPLSLYRGPFNLMGLGAGLAASMLAVGVLPVAALSAVFYATYRWPVQSCPTSTQVVWASNFVGYDPVTTSNPMQLPNWIVTAATVVLLTFIYM
jgi:H+/gluconate symporter-like permease